MNNNTDNKNKYIVIFVVVLMVSIGLFILNKYKNGARPGPVSFGNEPRVSGPANMAKDSDGDGLADWEEQLWGTDPYNDDTDGDGVNDNLNVVQKSLDQELRDSKNLQVDSGVSATDRLVREILLQYGMAKQTGDFSTLDTSTKVAVNTIVGGVERSLEKPVYRVDGLKRALTDSDPEWQRYNIELNQIFSAHAPRSGVTDEMELLNKMFIPEKPDYTYVPELLRIASVYSTVIKKMSVLEVPPGALESHANIMNGYNMLASGLNALKNMEQDPVVGVVGVAQYRAGAKLIQQWFATLRDQFIAHGVKRS